MICLGSSSILSSAPVTHVAVLERHEDEAVLALDQETAVAKAMNLNRYEFNYMKAPPSSHTSTSILNWRLIDALMRERGVLAKVIAGADETFLVQRATPLRYASLDPAPLGSCWLK